MATDGLSSADENQSLDIVLSVTEEINKRTLTMSRNKLIAFNPESEEDVRIAVAHFFLELGFELDEMKFEDSFTITLGTNTLVVNKGERCRDTITGRSDMLLTRFGQPLAIVETKRPDHKLVDADRDQAISYARLLKDIAPIAIVTNGEDIRLYDVYTTELLPDSIQQSSWQHDEIPSITQDFRYQAAKTLIGVNLQTLMEFCAKQRERTLSDIRGSISEYKKYIPELYEPREDIERSFEEFLQSDCLCFPLIAESGLGKTNVLCALAEKYGEDSPVLFYSGLRLRQGLVDAITNDFIWEFTREHHVAYVIDRFNSLAIAHNMPILIFFDALDEFTGSIKRLKAELIDFIPRLGGTAVKVCLSCKAFDWERYVIDYGTTYNGLAKATFPKRDEVHNPQRSSPAQARNVGTWLPLFSDSELERTWTRYKDAYGLAGELQGETRTECRNPLIMRLVAETYAGQRRDIPSEISHEDVFRLYWDRRLGEIEEEQRYYAESMLCSAAEMMVEGDASQVEERSFRDRFASYGATADEAYTSVLRLHLLERRKDDQGNAWLAFPFEKLRAYILTVRSRRWKELMPEDIIDQVPKLMDSQLGREAVNFYLTVVDRGASDLLTGIARCDLDLFLRLIRDQDLSSPATSAVSEKEMMDLITKRLSQFAATYSVLIHAHFPNLTHRFEPCTSREVGLLFNWPFYAFRPMTSEHPERLLYLPDDIFRRVYMREAPEIREDLRCGGITNSHASDLVNSLPQKVAWTMVVEEVTKLMSEQFLNESSTPEILQEKIYELLFRCPSIWLEGSPRGHYWEYLGYHDEDEVYSTSLTELHDKVSDLIKSFASTFHKTDSESLRRWYDVCLQDLFVLRFYLEQLKHSRACLLPPRFSLDELYSYMKSHGYEQVLEHIATFLPHILESYKVMVKHNFPSLETSFPFYRHQGARLIVEISQPEHTDFLHVLYLLLPSSPAQEPPQILFSTPKGSLVERAKLHVRSAGNLFGVGEVELEIDSKTVIEPHAIFTRTRYPSHTPITDQVYQLITNEAEHVFGPTFRRYDVQFASSTQKQRTLYYLARRRWNVRE